MPAKRPNFLKDGDPKKFFSARLKALTIERQNIKAKQLRIVTTTLYKRSCAFEKEMIDFQQAFDAHNLTHADAVKKFRDFKRRVKKHDIAINNFAKNGKRYFKTFQMQTDGQKFSDNPVEAIGHAAWRKLTTLNRFVLQMTRELR
jgi:hypothetical protein